MKKDRKIIVFGRALVCFDLIFMHYTFIKMFFFLSLSFTVGIELTMMYNKVCGVDIYFYYSFRFVFWMVSAVGNLGPGATQLRNHICPYS